MSRPTKLTTLAVKDVLNSAATFFIGRGQWEVAYQTDGTLVLRHRSGPSVALGCLLLFLMILPGILYLLLAKGGESTVTIRATTETAGTLVTTDWSGQEWRGLAKQFLGSLPDIAENP